MCKVFVVRGLAAQTSRHCISPRLNRAESLLSWLFLAFMFAFAGFSKHPLHPAHADVYIFAPNNRTVATGGWDTLDCGKTFPNPDDDTDRNWIDPFSITTALEMLSSGKITLEDGKVELWL